MSPNKRKRERSRSKSITPPPKLTAHQRANAMNLVRSATRRLITRHSLSHCNSREALAYQSRSPSPTFTADDPTDLMDLDPELAKIAEAARQKAKHAHIGPERGGGPEAVNIKVRWLPHPRNPLAQEQCWAFKVGRVRLSLLHCAPCLLVQHWYSMILFESYSMGSPT